MLAISRSRALLCAAFGVAVAVAIVAGSARKENRPETTDSDITERNPSDVASSAAARAPRRLPQGHSDDLAMVGSPRSNKANRRSDSPFEDSNNLGASEYKRIQLATLAEPIDEESDEDTSSQRRPQKLPAPTEDEELAPRRGRLEELVEGYRERVRSQNVHTITDDDESAPPAYEAAPNSQAASPSRSTTPKAVKGTRPITFRKDDQDRLTIVLKETPIRDALDLFSQQGNLNILASTAVTGNVSASLQGVELEEGLAAILKSAGLVARQEGSFLYVGTPDDFEQLDESQDIVSTRVYQPNYVKAAELQNLITSLLSEKIGRATVTRAADIDIPSDQVKTGGDSNAGQDCLLVRDYETVLCEIDQIISEVDRKPRQVEIEATILSVKLDDTHKLGINFQALRDVGAIRLATGSPPTALNSVAFGDGGLKIAYLDSTLGGLVEALESIGETNVIASPRLMCLNKQRAEIQIGERLGFVSTTVTETSSTQSIQFLDVGTLLRLRPFIASDGTIRMELHPELSTGQVRIQGNLTLPNKAVTQVTTNVMCRDGNTIVLGGLMREDLGTNTKQLPLLGDIPYVGGLFRQRTTTVSKSELLIVVTPRLVQDECAAQEGVALEHEFRRRQGTYFDKLDWTQRRVLGQKWLRKARAAWAAGDGESAMKHVNAALHHDPMNREASNLRAEIAEIDYPHETQHAYLHQGLLGHGEDHTGSQPWKDQFHGSFDGSMPGGVDDPGVPTLRFTPVRPRPNRGFDTGIPSEPLPPMEYPSTSRRSAPPRNTPAPGVPIR
jgi:type IV pilus assembly protein PilQ